ncbi:sensor histidine kinase [Rhodohalobacter sp. SW132]|uniref:sensor histidine kinase n=1 Tax=Rhodohalobacter sp. SW132 TaxID=2293433 RepID=UPI001315A2C9|nr:HAMP domain-containing sensor histidine kinase [Rhodohalobacter sp. SW132]
MISLPSLVPAGTFQGHPLADDVSFSQHTDINPHLTSDVYTLPINASGNTSDWIEKSSGETELAAAPWWSIWYYVVLTIVVGCFLIYGYIEYGKNVVSVRHEIDEIKEENERLNKELGKRMKEIDSVIDQLKIAEDELVKKSEKAGMAEIAAGVLHNVANVLSSVNSSNCYIMDTAKNSKVEGLIKANQLLREHIDHIDQFIFQNPKGKKLLQYYLKLEEPLKKERESIVTQSERLEKKINIINDVITAQQNHASSPQETTETSLTEVVEATLSLQDDLVDQYKLSVTNELNAETPVIAQRSKLIHVLVNFIKNAGESMEDNHPENRHLTIKSWEDPYKVYLSVSDNGSGIKAENLDKIFSHTYTTKKKVHGFGLHSSATYMKEMGGKIEVNSGGIGKGTTFTLVFPIIRDKEFSGQN